MAEIVRMRNEELKRTAKSVAEQFGVPNCIVLTEDGTGGVRMVVIGAGSEKVRKFSARRSRTLTCETRTKVLARGVRRGFDRQRLHDGGELR